MSINKKHLTYTSLILTSLLLVACDDKEETEAKDNVKEEVVTIDYSNINQQVKIDSYLNKIEDYNFEGYFYPAGIQSYDRTVMSKSLNKIHYNPNFFNFIYAMTNGDFDENTLIKEYNVLYEYLTVFGDALAEMKDQETLHSLNTNKITLEEFKASSVAQQESIKTAYENIKNLSFESTEGQELLKVHLHYLDYWMIEINNQFEKIKRLTEDRQKNYNVTDFVLRLSNYGEEANYVGTYIILLEAKKIKETGLLEIEDPDKKDSDKDKGADKDKDKDKDKDNDTASNTTKNTEEN